MRLQEGAQGARLDGVEHDYGIDEKGTIAASARAAFWPLSHKARLGLVSIYALGHSNPLAACSLRW
jgi:hypothetical protein